MRTPGFNAEAALYPVRSVDFAFTVSTKSHDSIEAQGIFDGVYKPVVDPNCGPCKCTTMCSTSGRFPRCGAYCSKDCKIYLGVWGEPVAKFHWLNYSRACSLVTGYEGPQYGHRIFTE